MAKNQVFKMYPVEIYICSDGDIAIRQTEMGEDSLVILHPSQILPVIRELERLATLPPVDEAS